MIEATLNAAFCPPVEQKRIVVERRRAQNGIIGAEVAVDKTIDARGAYCPTPLMELMAAIKHEPSGSVIEVLSSVPGSAKEIPFWADRAGHAHLKTEKKQGYWSIVIRKK
ncbi:MAG: hypothetical protein CO150_06390 [Nitrospirae bacterium CG_4_9_14_3_um_filter_53_35]|nr:MAG: hypothetical protein COT35_10525 [Nitrospirae bacterium CG08_land_8_20_14_0_20_52_24]PIV85419.1 MAG: hypothetical protein COW52_02355 [Nitrospirae bacterium CG17_big_fil_post_rev_8_21_14_2_50_50_9]PIW85193.1 MAG: hypothetical protein COZ95_05940 [Nitrospirae bacterium CG_4_8_14_3_um_filter_50_41]PIX84547.1 MAG: hypothetical protein COZ32_13135 [Nitrospirae bacterium CG_4_10_14_3_um_filter_53_41]PJA74584.1 MAG: hypothetical protein CO150_06390 [Nitrospirae bacterium CG_4_9_14_3_um_filter